MKKNKKKLITLLLCLFIIFNISIDASAKVLIQPTPLHIITTIQEKPYIQQMLNKLETILDILNKKGNITVECIDENNNIIYSKTDNNLKFGSYTYEAPELEEYILNDENNKTVTISRIHKNQKINFFYKKNVNSIMITNFGTVNNETITYDESRNIYIGVDCTQAIKNALASGYEKIEFPSGGNFIINSTILVDNKIIIEGNGANIYTNPNNNSDKNIFYFRSGSSGSSINNLNFYSKKAYKVNLNTNVTAKSSNVCAIGINSNAENILINKCYGEGLKYFSGCSVCKNITFNECSGKDNYFTIYTGYNAYNTTIKKCNFSEQIETDMYGHILYLGGASYGVNIEDCYFEALGDNSSNIIKCGADQKENCIGITVKNTTMKCRSKTSFLYCHANADVEYNNCNMIFNCSTNSDYPRLLQFNNYSKMKFKDCNFELDSIQKFTHTNNSLINNSLIFENCDFKIKNTINKYLTLDLNAGSKEFKLINCNLDYSSLDRPINILNQNLYSLEINDCNLYLPAGSTIGKYNKNDVQYSLTNSPKLIISDTNIFRKYSNIDNSLLINYSKGNTAAEISLKNIKIINGQANNGVNKNKYKINDTNSEYKIFENVTNEVNANF